MTQAEQSRETERSIEEPDASGNSSSLSIKENSWSQWTNDIKTNVLSQVEIENGDRVNGYYCLKITEYLLSKMPLFPVWSTVYQSKFGYDNDCEPASSASVEGEFNKLKNCVFKNRLAAKIRPDEAIEKHVEYRLGRNLIDMARASDDTLVASTDRQVQESEGDNGEETIESEKQEDNNENPSVNEHDGNSSADEDHEHLSVNENDRNSAESFSIVCPACANGDKPGGAHKSFHCDRAIHALDHCSVPCSSDDSSEGYGQSRICLDCFSTLLPESTRVEAAKKFEDWGGEVSKNSSNKRKRGGLYLGGNSKYIKDKLNFENHRSLPILKNGSNLDIKAVHLNDKEVTLRNTCHPDAIFQLMLAGYSDYPEIEKHVSKSYA